MDSPARSGLGEGTSPTSAASRPALPGLGSARFRGHCPASPSQGRVGRELTQGRQSLVLPPRFPGSAEVVLKAAIRRTDTTTPEQRVWEPLTPGWTPPEPAVCSLNPDGFRV